MAESPPDISQLVSLPCNALHAEFYTSASSPTLLSVVSLNYLSASSQLYLDYNATVDVTVDVDVTFEITVDVDLNADADVTVDVYVTVDLTVEVTVDVTVVSSAV